MGTCTRGVTQRLKLSREAGPGLPSRDRPLSCCYTKRPNLFHSGDGGERPEARQACGTKSTARARREREAAAAPGHEMGRSRALLGGLLSMPEQASRLAISL
eukprot:1145904-Pelagomonas_calceolata.AAC.9